MKKMLPIMLVLLLGAVAYAEASDRQVVIEIEGMTCELCAVAIKKSLREVKGVMAVKVSFKEKKAWLTTDTSVTDEMLMEAIRKAGAYTGNVIEKKTIAD